MTRRRYGRNHPCPCGSGRKYKQCCWGRGFTWTVDAQGHLTREVPLAADLLAALEQQRQRFVQHHEREPGPDDLLFFDAPPPEQLEHQIVQAMQRAGLDPAFIYAFAQTGLLVSTDNEHLIPTADLARWQAAQGPDLTSLSYQTVRMEEPAARLLITLLDGTRDRAAILAALHDRTGLELTASDLDANLVELARLFLLEPPH